MNAVAIFAGSFAFAAGLTMGVMNARVEGDTRNPNSVWSRLLLGRPKQSTKENQISGETTEQTSPQETAPVLVLGLPRSGSLAIHNFFSCNEIQSSHYCCDANQSSTEETRRTQFPCRADQVTCGACVLGNMKQEKQPFEGCGNYHVWSQFDVETTEPYAWFLPQHFTLPLIHHWHPHAAIILNYRGDPGVWADSVLHWHSVTTRLFNSFGLNVIEPDDLPPVPDEITKDTLIDDMQTSLNRVMDEKEHQRKRDLLIKVFLRHLDKVRKWAGDYGHPLMEINVDDPNAGKDLAKAFQMSPSCWAFDAAMLDNDWRNFTFPF